MVGFSRQWPVLLIKRIAFVLVLTTACSDTTGPGATKTITLGPCLVGSYFAYRNEGGDWVELPLVSRTSATFVATPRVEIAFGSTVPNTAVRATSEELESVDCRDAPFQALAGTFVNVGADELFAIAAGGQHQLIYPPYTSGKFTFFTDSAGPVDIIATISAPASTFNSSTTRKIIVRRSVASPQSGLLPFDVTSPEAVSPDAAAITVDPLVAGEGSSLDLRLLTVGGTRTVLPTPLPAATPFPIPVLPSALAMEGDLYRLQYGAIADGAARYARHYFGRSLTHVVSLGPSLAVPLWPTQSPVLPYQSAYPGMASITYFGDHGRTATIIVTAQYREGTSAEWSLEWPAGMNSSGFTTWKASAFDAPLSAVLGAEVWKKDAQYRWATRSGAVVPAGPSVVGSGGAD